jgi:hypothetical protein
MSTFANGHRNGHLPCRNGYSFASGQRRTSPIRGADGRPFGSDTAG